MKRFRVGDHVRIVENWEEEDFPDHGNVIRVEETKFGRQYLDIKLDENCYVNKFAGHCELYR